MDLLVSQLRVAIQIASQEVGRIATEPRHALRLAIDKAQVKTEHRRPDNVLLEELVHENIRWLSRVSFR